MEQPLAIESGWLGGAPVVAPQSTRRLFARRPQHPSGADILRFILGAIRIQSVLTVVGPLRFHQQLHKHPVKTQNSSTQPAELETPDSRQQDIEFLHEIGTRIATAHELHAVLERIVNFVSSILQCDSCFVYVLEQDRLVLRASKNPHTDVVDQLGISVGQGITGWVAEHLKPAAIPAKALRDPRFKLVHSLPEDLFEAFLSVPILCRGKLVGVINVQHRKPYHHTAEEVRLLSMIGFLVGAEIERARLESENIELSAQLETRKLVDRAKSILQNDLHIKEEEAYLALQQESRQRRKSMREIAEAVVLSDELRRKRQPS
ncbi:ANTAR domain-containing protein [Acidipila rosea]|uniref:ANTAR domain-containing protein n=1 Tax=Acidipila rosea TaxID=768535 RepID=A0A4R1L3Q8_9BACT|nr:ANTAR domain-containing protein [Acidipila rosea]